MNDLPVQQKLIDDLAFVTADIRAHLQVLLDGQSGKDLPSLRNRSGRAHV